MLPEKDLLLEFFLYLSINFMSNLDLWFFSGVVVLVVSIAYIIRLVAQFMAIKKKENRASPDPSDARSIKFFRHALLALAGITIGTQFLHYHQEQLSKQDIEKNAAISNALSNKLGNASGFAGMHVRPTSRPPRGVFSLSEAEVGRKSIPIKQRTDSYVEKVPAPITP